MFAKTFGIIVKYVKNYFTPLQELKSIWCSYETALLFLVSKENKTYCSLGVVWFFVIGREMKTLPNNINRDAWNKREIPKQAKQLKIFLSQFFFGGKHCGYKMNDEGKINRDSIWCTFAYQSLISNAVWR